MNELHPHDYKNIVIVGLPGSGKTTLMNTFKNYIHFDDFISTLYNGELLKALNENKPVCICDPRLCNHGLFQYYIDLYFDKRSTKVVLFENTPNQCIENIEGRNNIIPRTGLRAIIKQLSSSYNLENYHNYETEIRSVYKPSSECCD